MLGALGSRRLSYRRLSLDDVDVFHKLCLDAHVKQYLLDGTAVPVTWAVEAVHLSDRLFETDGVGLWIVALDRRPIGFCGFRRFHELGIEPQLVFALTKPHTGSGYATEAAEAMVGETRRLGWPRVVAAVDAPNTASVRLLERLGFTGCGRVPGHFGDTLLFERFGSQAPVRLSAQKGVKWELTVEHTWDGDRVGAAEAVVVGLELGHGELTLAIDAPFHDDPAPQTDDLWNYEVVELMLVGANGKYLEVELSPHGGHLVLFLDGERNIVHRGVALDYRAEINESRWQGVAHVPVGWLPTQTTRLNAFSVHGIDERRRYLAWRPTRGHHPDFHRLAMFGFLEECSRGGR